MKNIHTQSLQVLATALLLTLGSTQALAEASHLPSALLYHGKPIEPLCFNSDAEKSPKFFDIKACEESNRQENIEIKPMNTMHENDRGYFFRNKSESNTSYSSISYRYISSSKHAELVLVEWSGGGSGYFSDLYWLKREGDVLEVVNHVSGGDKCNGGIGNVHVDGQDVTIERNVTPADFFKLADVTPPHKKMGYSYLPGHHNACFGQMREVNGKFTAYIPDYRKSGFFGDYMSEKPPTKSDDKNYYETCFFKQFREVPERKQWTPAQMTEFMTHFNRSCIENKP